MTADYSAVITAAGGASRFGGLGQLKEKVGGKSVLCHSIDIFDADDDCREIILAVSPAVRSWIEGDPLTFACPKLKLCSGGASRAESSALGARLATGKLLVLHDGNRPNFNAALLGRLNATVLAERGAVPGLPVNEGVAYVTAIGGGSGNGEPPEDDLFGAAKADHRAGHVMEHVQSGGLYVLQTPQVYYRASFLKALESAGGELSEFTDDSAVYLAGGFEVAVVAGLPGNRKVVSPADLKLLLKLMGSGTKPPKDKYGGLGW